MYYKTITFVLFTTILFGCKKTASNEFENLNNLQTITSNSGSTTSFDFLPKATSNQIVKHEFYGLSYNETYEQADWVAYFLEGNKAGNKFERPFFEQDKLVTTESADWRNYKKSGYDKGHLCPAGDMKFSKSAFDDTFLTSNISPQKHDFNEGVWNRMEQKTRYWADKYKGVYVVTAGVLKTGLATIGTEEVAVPEFFYKIVCRKSDKKMIAFLVAHQDSDAPLYDFVVSVDEVEKQTGLDFFPGLEDSLENKLERSSSWKEW
ncbi:MAG: Nuclease [Bacteroidota bacterium]|jgi:endonuclease G